MEKTIAEKFLELCNKRGLIKEKKYLLDEQLHDHISCTYICRIKLWFRPVQKLAIC